MQTSNAMTLERLIDYLDRSVKLGGTMRCAVDRSGSISTSEWGQWLKIINHLYDQAQCQWEIITFGCTITRIGSHPKDLPLSPSAEATLIKPVFEYFKRYGRDNDTLLIFTDGFVADCSEAETYVAENNICFGQGQMIYVVPMMKTYNGVAPGSHSCNTFVDNNLVVPRAKKESASRCPCAFCNPTKNQEEVKEEKVEPKAKPRFVVVELGNFYNLSAKDLQQTLNDKIPEGYSVKDVNCIPGDSSGFLPRLQWVAICEVKE